MLQVDLPYRLDVGCGVIVRVARVVQRMIEAGEAVSFPIDVIRDYEHFIG